MTAYYIPNVFAINLNSGATLWSSIGYTGMHFFMITCPLCFVIAERVQSKLFSDEKEQSEEVKVMTEVLEHHSRRKLMRKVLERQFSVELLNFYQDYLELQKTYQKAHSKFLSAYLKLEEMYLVANAPLKINIPGHILKDYFDERAITEESGLSPVMLGPVKDAVLSVMYKNAYSKFNVALANIA